MVTSCIYKSLGMVLWYEYLPINWQTFAIGTHQVVTFCAKVGNIYQIDNWGGVKIVNF